MRIQHRHLALGFAGAAALAFAVWAWRSASERERERNLERELGELHDDSATRKRQPPPLVRRQLERSEESARAAVFSPPAGGDPLEPSAHEAIEAFDAVIDELELALDDERKLSPVERDEYYERATGSFKAMSAWIDGSSASERRLLEDSHKQMMELMRKLDIKPPEREIDGFVSARER